MPQQLLVVDVAGVALLLGLLAQGEDLVDLKLVGGVGGGVRVLDVFLDYSELLAVLVQWLYLSV